MCNLYRLDKGQDHLRFFKVARDDSGNQPPLPGIYPDNVAPVIRQERGERVMQMARWGMPTPPRYLKAGAIDRGVTNVHNVQFWRRWLTPEFRSLVPATAFSEYADEPDPVTKMKLLSWFALDETQPVFAFAGIWCNWTGTRGTKKNFVGGEHQLFAFLTCPANGVVAPVHSKAMPVLLTTEEECEAWLTAPVEDALQLQRPFPDVQLKIVATGARTIG
jgi:putative SOS response-associated peptidase YedK